MRGRTEVRKAANRERQRSNKKDHNRRQLEWYYKNKHKKQAHAKVFSALRYGRLQKRPCEVCGNPVVEAHHDDYSKPLEVRWVCERHHKEIHRRYP